MYYRVLLNGEELGLFGDDNVENLHLSVSGGVGDMYFFASAVCREGEQRVLLDWIQRGLKAKDSIEIRPARKGPVFKPRKRFVMDRPQREASEDRWCDFCQRKETEVPRLIYTDEHRPAICCDCVEICQTILEGES